jgi:hypothetical protein
MAKSRRRNGKRRSLRKRGGLPKSKTTKSTKSTAASTASTSSIQSSISKPQINEGRRNAQRESINKAIYYFKEHPSGKIGWYVSYNKEGYAVGMDVNKSDFEKMLENEVPYYLKTGDIVMFKVPCIMCKLNLH